MAGIVPRTTPRSSGRKQWTLHDGPKGSLRRLRNQLAEDGCPESQVVLAKQLLEETSELDIDRDENARLGVYWLIKASEQGNEEATTLLKECLETGQGISEHNYVDVNMCLTMSQDEKLARRAAREMFSSLSAGQDFITTDQLEQRIRDCSTCSLERQGLNHHRLKDNKQIEDSQDEVRSEDKAADDRDIQKERRDWSLKGEFSGEKLTEEHLVAAAVHYARGELPIVHKALVLNTVERTVQSMNYLQRSVFHPFISFKIFYNKFVKGIAKQGMSFFSNIFPFAFMQLQIFILIFIYSAIETESLFLFVPLFLYYVSFCAMVVSTFCMLQKRKEFQDFHMWSRLFLTYSGGNLNPEEAEYQYCKSSMRPYGHFFLALLINLMMYPIIASQWTPQSEFTILSIFLTFATLFSFMNTRGPDLLLLFSFAIHVLAKYPYETDEVVGQGWRFLDIRIPTFASYVVGSSIEFCLNFRAVFYLFIPIIFVRIASRDNWRGIYKALIPHCVTLSWWQMAVISSQGATWYGLIRGALALVGLVLFLPLVGILSLLLPIAAMGKYMADSITVTHALITVLLASLPIILSWYLSRRRHSRNIPDFLELLISKIQIFLGIAATVFFVYPLLIASGENGVQHYSEPIGSLSWEQYQNYCHQPAWERASVAAVQVECTHLLGSTVSWEGYVASVKLESISNPLQNIISKLPLSMQNTLACLYGEHYNADCSLDESGRCTILEKLNLKRTVACHLEAWNRYEFKIHIKMNSGMWGTGALVFLVADDSFRNFTLALRSGDRVWFTGTLTNGKASEELLGGARPHIELEEIGCLGCHRSDLQSHKKVTNQVEASTVLEYAYVGVKFVLNFLFNPLVIIR